MKDFFLEEKFKYGFLRVLKFVSETTLTVY